MVDPVNIPGKPLVTVHATAVVVGETGVLITGPSGSGKSRIALDLLQAARAEGRFAALVSDDQVGLCNLGQHVLAVAPGSIRGMIEVRGSAIMKTGCLERALMHIAIAAGQPTTDRRLPLPNDQFAIAPDLHLPLLYMVPGHQRDPLELIRAFRQDQLVR